MLKIVFVSFVLLATLISPPAQATERSVDEIKRDIVAMAKSFTGQGDPDFAIQNQLDVLVEELLAVAPPQPPASERIDLLVGPWKQLWGQYDYTGGDDRGVDPRLGVEDIYQVVFPGGYYYNVSPYEGRRFDFIALLRGQYTFVEGYPDMIKGKFTDFPGSKSVPEGVELWELAEMAENEELPDRTTVVPSWIVWLFFGSGYLREAYTDDTMRLIYGGDELDDRDNEYLYVLVRP